MTLINNISNNAFKVSSKKVKQKQFSWIISAVFLIAFGYHLFNNTLHPFLLGASIIGLGLSFLVSKIVFPFLYIWMIIGSILSEISSTIILAIIYFTAFLPIKLFKFEKQAPSGWIKTDSETNFYEQF